MQYEIKQNANDIHIILSDIFSLSDTLQSGQTFRWKPYKDGFKGIVGEKVVYISQNENELVFHDCTLDDFELFWKAYFAFEEDYSSIRQIINVDENVSEALKYCSGIRIMRQPLWETVISFIISANNNIPRIMGIIEKLSVRFGKKISTPYGDEYMFPTAEALADADVSQIRECGAGYRDVYIKRTATAFANGEFDSEKLYSLQYNESKKHIMTLCGVGGKVADCILLFSVGKQEAFPVDVWVRKVVSSLYFEEKELTASQIERFAAEHFPQYAGFAQQVLFHYIRNYR